MQIDALTGASANDRRPDSLRIVQRNLATSGRVQVAFQEILIILHADVFHELRAGLHAREDPRIFPGLLVRLSIVDGDLVARSYLTVNKDLTPLGYLPTRCFTSALFSWQMYSISSPSNSMGRIVNFQGLV